MPTRPAGPHERDGAPAPSSTGREHGARLPGGPWSVRAYLLLILALAALLVAGAVGYGYAWSARQAERQAEAAMQAQAQVATREVAQGLGDAILQVERVARQRGIAAMFAQPSECSVVIGGSEAFPTARLDIVGPAGQIGCSSQPLLVDLAEPVHATADWFTAALSSAETSVRWPATDAVTGRPAVVVSAPIPGPGGGAAGVVALVLDAGAVAGSLADSLTLPDDAVLAVVDTEAGALVSTSDDDATGRDGAGTVVGRPAQGRWTDRQGVVRIYGSDAVQDVGGVPWRVYSGIDRATVLSAAQGGLVRQSLLGALALLALGAALWLLNRRVAGPLAALTRGVLRVGDDADDARVPERGTAEITTLSRAFNNMLDIRAGQEVRLAYQATHDRLTGLPNKDWFRTRLDGMLAGASGRPPVVVLCVGISRFQSIGDALGPDGAERVLVEVAERLRSAVGGDDVLARSDAGEFLVACARRSADDAVALAERLELAVEEPMGWHASGLVVRLATGIAVERQEGDGTNRTSAEQLVREAATALSQALTRSRTWVVFDDSMRVRAAELLETERGLRDALAHGGLEVHYQPIVDTRTGLLTGAEALVRWRHPERGLVPPMQFIPIAEQTGQISAIGRLVLAEACAQAARWAAGGSPLTVSVNVAAEQLLDPGFADDVRRVLAATDLPSERLCLEVTESAVVRRAGAGAENLGRLRALGVAVAVDDFGTGYSSLSYLKHLPITTLKIDRSFITRLEHDHRDRHLVEAVLGMANALGLSVVAEGVETREQRETLIRLGCESAQGFLFGRPGPADELLPATAQRLGAGPLAPAPS